MTFHYDRLLEEEWNGNNNNRDNADFVETLQDKEGSWIPIYVPLALTILQSVVFLMIFEVSRRSPYVGSVFDRRRRHSPSRTPPPLMRRRGRARGWLAFEWWHIRVADDAYNRQAMEEARQTNSRQRYNNKKHRKKGREEKNQHPMDDASVPSETNNSTERSDTNLDKVDFIQQAEAICYQQSPFCTMTMSNTNDENAEMGGELSTNGKDESVTAVIGSFSTTTPSSLTTRSHPIDKEIVGKQFLADNIITLIPVDESGASTKESSGLLDTKEPEDRSERSPGSLTGKLKRLFQLDPSTHDDSEAPASPRPLSPTKTSVKRKVRFDSCCTLEGGRGRTRAVSQDISLTSEEGKRLARARFDGGKDVPDWDTRALAKLANKATGFVKRRVIMLGEKRDTGTDNWQRGDDTMDNENGETLETTETTQNPSSKKMFSDRVMRRPLSLEKQELLRCIGLDAFVTLRFLEFGFDVAFWPFLFSLITLIPVYATAKNNVVGFFSTTAVALAEGSPRHWMIVLFGCLQFSYILRRIWIEWEFFLPLRYDYLEHGDFVQEKYQEEYRRTCIVEYVPKSHRNDKALFQFFDSIFPGQIKRAEVLLNTEHLRSLINERLSHIIAYEDVYAKKVRRYAEFLRYKHITENSGPIKRCCRKTIFLPKEPEEPRIIVQQYVERPMGQGNFILNVSKTVRDYRTYRALDYHYSNISRLNKEVEDEYLRIAREQRRHHDNTEKNNKSFIAKCFPHLFIPDTGQLHSSTAFVQFHSVAAKQMAIQCNLTGTNNFFDVKEVPEVRDIRWGNAHVPSKHIEARKGYANTLLLGCLIAWSFLVSFIRSIDDISSWLGWDQPIIAMILDDYVPALVVEGLVRTIPLALDRIGIWIRFKSSSIADEYVLNWYFGFRLITFFFVIIGGSLVDSGGELVDDPVGFMRHVSNNVAENAQFFIGYVVITGGLQIGFRFSQLHNLLKHWIIRSVITEEAVSQRRLENLRTCALPFHQDEFIPLFLFIFMVAALYACLAPLACLFVAIFFKVAYRVFKFMALFIYGNKYEGGGFIFYTLNTVLFLVLYMLVFIISGYLSLRGDSAMAGVFSVMLFVVLAVHMGIHHTFIRPSRSLALTKARISDEITCQALPRRGREKRRQNYLKGKQECENFKGENKMNGRGSDGDLVALLEAQNQPKLSSEETQSTLSSADVPTNDNANTQEAVERMEMRYMERTDTFSDLTDSELSGPRPDFFTYRQPSMNRATWECAPRPYRQQVQDSGDVANKVGESWR